MAKSVLKSPRGRTHAQRLEGRGTAKVILGQLKVPAEKKEGKEKQTEEVVGLIPRNPRNPEESLALSANDYKSGALIIVLNDLEPHSIIVGEAASADQPFDAVSPAHSSGSLPE